MTLRRQVTSENSVRCLLFYVLIVRICTHILVPQNQSVTNVAAVGWWALSGERGVVRSAREQLVSAGRRAKEFVTLITLKLLVSSVIDYYHYTKITVCLDFLISIVIHNLED